MSLKEKIIHIVDPPRVKPKRPGRNEPCPCGSGTKFKKCCMILRRYDS